MDGMVDSCTMHGTEASVQIGLVDKSSGTWSSSAILFTIEARDSFIKLRMPFF